MFYGNYATQIEFITERWIGTSVSVLLTHISGAFIFKHVQVRNPQKSMFNTFGFFFLFLPLLFCCSCGCNIKERIKRISAGEKLCKLVCDISDSLPFGQAKPETKAAPGKWGESGRKEEVGQLDAT